MKRHTRTPLLLALLVFAAFWPGFANAERIERLVRILETSSSYKVRLQVVITLGKLKDRRAVPALVRALSDGNYTVRGVAATALGQIGDRGVLPHLKRVAKADKEAFVRSQATRAIAVLGGGGAVTAGGGPPAGSRFFVTVGKLSNKAGRSSAQYSEALRKALLKEFSHVSGVATPWSSTNPSGADLAKFNLKGFVLDGSILELSDKRSGGDVELSCNIRVSLATYPGNSMKAFYTGGASMAVPASSFKPSTEEGLFKEIIEGAAQGAREHIVQSYLSNQ